MNSSTDRRLAVLLCALAACVAACQEASPPAPEPLAERAREPLEPTAAPRAAEPAPAREPEVPPELAPPPASPEPVARPTPEVAAQPEVAATTAAPQVVVGMVVLPDLGLAFESPTPLTVVGHDAQGWRLIEVTAAGEARVLLGAAAREGLAARRELMISDFEAFVAGWRKQPGKVLDARLVPASRTAPAWARIARRLPDGERVDVGLVLDGERTLLVQVDGPGVAESQVLDTLQASLAVFAPVESIDEAGVLRRTDLPVGFALPPGWRREPDRALRPGLTAVSPLPADGTAPSKLHVRLSDARFASLAEGADKLAEHLGSASGELLEREAGRLRGIPALRYTGREGPAQAATLWRRGVLLRTRQGQLLALELASTEALPSTRLLEEVLAALELERKAF